MNPKNPMSNASGCADPTAYYGMKLVMQEELKQQQAVSALVHYLKAFSDLAGFDVVGRIVLCDKATGKIYK